MLEVSIDLKEIRLLGAIKTSGQGASVNGDNTGKDAEI